MFGPPTGGRIRSSGQTLAPAAVQVSASLDLYSTGDTYRAVHHLLPLGAALLDVALERARVERLEQLEAAQQLVADAHDGAPVVELAAVVGRGEDGDEDAVLKELVAVLDDHVGAADEVEVVALQEVHDDGLAEAVADAALVGLPVGRHVGRVAPQQVVEQAVVRHVGGARDLADVVHVGQAGAQAAVHAEDLARHDGGDGQAVEGVDERLPDLDGGAALALVVEAVDARHVGALVVPPQQEEVLRVLELVAEEQQDGLEALLAAVHVVAEEEVVGVRREAAHLEGAQQVRVLPVDVAHDLDRRVQLDQRRLAQQQLAHRRAHGRDLGVLQAHRLGRLGRVAGVEQPVDHLVEVDGLEAVHAHAGRAAGRIGQAGAAASAAAVVTDRRQRRVRVDRIDLVLLPQQDRRLGLRAGLAGRVVGTAGHRALGHVVDLAHALRGAHVLVAAADRRRHGRGRRRLRRAAAAGPVGRLLGEDVVVQHRGRRRLRAGPRRRLAAAGRPEGRGVGPVAVDVQRGARAVRAAAAGDLGADDAAEGPGRLLGLGLAHRRQAQPVAAGAIGSIPAVPVLGPRAPILELRFLLTHSLLRALRSEAENHAGAGPCLVLELLLIG